MSKFCRNFAPACSGANTASDGWDADETVAFALDGAQYEIDLSSKNATKLRDSLVTFIEAGTKAGRGRVNPVRRDARQSATPAVNRGQNRVIREWAQKRASRCPTGGASNGRSWTSSTTKPTTELTKSVHGPGRGACGCGVVD